MDEMRDVEVARPDDGRIDWPRLFLEHSAGDVFEYGKRVRARSSRTEDELAELFAQRRALRLEASEFIGVFAEAVERGDAGAVEDIFRAGEWTRYVDIAAFDSMLAEMVGPLLDSLDVKALNAIEDAVARSLRESAGKARADVTGMAPVLAAVLERARGLLVLEDKRKGRAWKRAALALLVIIFIVVRAYFRMK